MNFQESVVGALRVSCSAVIFYRSRKHGQWVYLFYVQLISTKHREKVQLGRHSGITRIVYPNDLGSVWGQICCELTLFSSFFLPLLLMHDCAQPMIFTSLCHQLCLENENSSLNCSSKGFFNYFSISVPGSFCVFLVGLDWLWCSSMGLL